jgi:hypothetical protein
MFKNPVPTSKKTQRISIKSTGFLMLLREIIAVYSEKHAKPVNKSVLCGKNAELLNVTIRGTYWYHCVLKGLKFLIHKMTCIQSFCRRLM